jgi:two-component system chemotaxis sensor kinase CheA
VQLIIHGGDTTADKHLLEMLKDPLMHLVRNAIYHGIELPTERMANGKSAQAKLTLSAKRTAAHVIIEVIDDGRGLNIEAVKKTAMEQGWNTAEEISSMSEQQLQALIFVSGFSTSQIIDDISGRGVGLDVVKNNVERLKGTLTVKSTFNQGCTFTIKLPLTLTTTHIFLIAIAKQRYAIPVEFVRMARYVSASEVFLVQDQETINWHGEAVSMAWLEDLLELSKGKRIDKKDNVSHKQPCLILETKAALLGVFVDEIVEEREIVLKPTGPLLDRVRNVSGITILDSGEVCVVLNPIDLVRTAQKKASSGAISWRVAEQLPDTKQQRKQTKPVILLAEDSITTRTQEKRILESAGYEVITAVDGLMAFNTLSTRSFDAVVSDVEMPNMDGLTLASKIREIKEYEHLPIVLVTSLATEADRKRGMDVGADAYIVKSAFNQQVLLDTLGRLV